MQGSKFKTINLSLVVSLLTVEIAPIKVNTFSSL